MPRFSFENKVTLSGLIQIGLLLFGLVAGYYILVARVDTAASDIVSLKEAVGTLPDLKERVSTIETRINIGQQQREKFQDTVLETLAEMQRQNLETQKAIARLEAKLP